MTLRDSPDGTDGHFSFEGPRGASSGRLGDWNRYAFLA